VQQKIRGLGASPRLANQLKKSPMQLGVLPVLIQKLVTIDLENVNNEEGLA